MNELPELVLDDDLALGEALAPLTRLALDHPAAAKRLFGLLCAEGEAFARTEAGRRWQERLRHSPRVVRAQAAFDAATAGLLQEADPGDVLPSNLLDALFASAP